MTSHVYENFITAFFIKKLEKVRLTKLRPLTDDTPPITTMRPHLSRSHLHLPKPLPTYYDHAS